MDTQVTPQTMIEHVTYQTRAGIDEAELLKINEALNAFLLQQPGFYYRSNSRDGDLHFDIVYWESAEAAQNASEAFMQSSEGQALMALTEESSITMRHMLAASEAMRCESEETAA